MLKDMPLISVVVPVYGTEKYLRKCLDSILNQTYKNIEIIVVNDCSKDNSDQIIQEYMLKYDNIKCVRHKKNRGLFQARISGAEEATGDYIAFVDSDDHISCDFYRLLVRKAVETSSDIVVGNFYLEYENGSREYFNLDPFHSSEFVLENDEVIKEFMRYEGLCYSWQLVWNKLYKKSLWDKGENTFKKFSNDNPGLIMTEDIAFSSFFWSHAKKVVNTMNANYFYCQRAGQSTDNVTQNKLVDHFNDTVAVFEFFKNNLEETNNYNEYKEQYNNWRKLYGRINYDNFVKQGIIDSVAAELKDKLFVGDEMHGLTFEDGYFYSLKTPLTESFNWFEDIKKEITKNETTIVSFDIFDTLIVRPFWLPTDLFYLMNSYFMKLTNAKSDINFANIRIESEKMCRQELVSIHSSFDDITLKEIYETMHNHYYIDEDTCEKLMTKEKELEIKFCSERKTGKELYQLAVDMGKTVIFTSDMYLEQDTIKKILKKNQYTEYNKLFLSSDIRLGKWSGKLYNHILKEFELKKPENMLHIGDNWDSDVEMPRKFGIRSSHIDKSINIFSNINNGIYGGEAFSQSFVHNSTGRDLNGGIWGFMGLRTMLAVVANKIYDNPYVNYNVHSDFNANPFYIGYYALGMHVYSVAKWLADEVANSSDKTIHFVARDGFILKKAYDVLFLDSNHPSSNYLYLSRKALVFADVISPIDMYSLIDKLNIRNTSPAKFIDMFRNMLDEEKIRNVKECLKDNGFFQSVKFNGREEYERFILFFINNVWDKLEWSKYKKLLKDYFKDIIHENDILFDIGYSGRSESALNNVLGFTLDSYYIHSNSEVLDRRKKANNFKNELFYYYKPYITGVMREHMFMKLAPSTIGYQYTESGVEPIFENVEIHPATKYITEKVQNSALQFVCDLKEIFGEFLDELYFRKEDASQPFEYYLHYAKEFDRNIFSTLIFEDDFGEGKKLRAVDFWSKEIDRTLNIQKNITHEDRVIPESRYIGVAKIESYDEEIIQKTSSLLFGKQETGKRSAMFYDKIEKEDSVDTKFAKCAGNTGNLIEWNAINNIIKPIIIKNWYMTNPGGFEEKDYDVFITTNLIWIEENTDLTYLDKVLKRIGDKVLLPVGVGFSSADDKKKFSLSDESVKTLAAIAERCNSIGVKGDYTAEILNNFGIRNVEIIGSPAIFNNIEIMKSIECFPEKIDTVSVSFKPFFGRTSVREKKLLSYFASNGCSLVDTTALELQKNNLSDDKLFSKITGWEKKKKVFFNIDDWSSELKKADFAMGMNFQNNILAMQSGVPALFINYESTGRELCKTFDLPCININDFDEEKSLKDYYNLVDLRKFINSIDSKYKDFNSFLKRNGIKVIDIENRIIEK